MFSGMFVVEKSIISNSKSVNLAKVYILYSNKYMTNDMHRTRDIEVD